MARTAHEQELEAMGSYLADVKRGDSALRKIVRGKARSARIGLQRTFSGRSATRRKDQARIENMQSSLYALLEKQPGFRKNVESGKKYLSGLSLPGVTLPRAPRTPAPFPHPTLKFIFPPYYDAWTWKATGSPGSQDAAADPAGTLSVGASGGGGSADAVAALVIAFRPKFSMNPTVRFSPMIQYSYDWLDFSFNGYTAHNDGYVRFVIESTDLRGGDLRREQQRDVQLWTDGTGWVETHGSNGDGTEVTGTLFPADSTFFVTASDARRYLITISCETSCDDSNGFWGGSLAEAKLAVRVPFLVAEEWEIS